MGQSEGADARVRCFRDSAQAQITSDVATFPSQLRHIKKHIISNVYFLNLTARHGHNLKNMSIINYYFNP